MHSNYVDINCDLGEGHTSLDCQNDAKLMPYISRCNIACGGHAGNANTMQKTIKNALNYDLKCGAHPGYADPENFGRVSLNLSHDNILNSVLSQIRTLQTVANSFNYPLTHIKLHGALYNDVESSNELADILCAEFASNFKHMSVIGLSGGAMQSAAHAHQLTFLKEGFIDRAYLSNGMLAPRRIHGSVYHQTDKCIQQLLNMLQGKPLLALSEQSTEEQLVRVKADTFCLHGDSSIASELAKSLHNTLIHQGYQVA